MPKPPETNALVEALRTALSPREPEGPGWMTPPQLARALGTSETSARRRLKVLIAAGRAERFQGNRPEGGTRVWYRLVNGKP